MRILWLTVDRSNLIAHHFDDFRKSVAELNEVEVVTLMKDLAGYQCENMLMLSRRLISGELVLDSLVTDYLEKDSNFDFIFCDAFFAYLNEDWLNIKIPSAIFIEDIHQKVPKYQIQRAKELGIETIFHRFNFAFHKFHPTARFDFNCFWLPHSIRMNRFSDYIKKSIDVLHVGVHRKQFYPNRYAAVEALRNKPYFKLIDRPQDQVGVSRIGKWPIDSDYDNLLQSAKITITGGSVFDAPVQKYFEIPSANSLLMSNWFPDLGLLGFIPETNMVTYHKENLVGKVEGLLKRDDKVKRISNNGYNLMLLKHTSDIRSKQFINCICTILGRQHLYNTEPCTHQVNFKPNKQKTTIKQREIRKTPKRERLALSHNPLQN